MNKISKWIIKKLGGYAEAPLPRTVYIDQQRQKPIKVVGWVDFIPGADREGVERAIASQIGLALLEAGMIKFEEIPNEDEIYVNPYNNTIVRELSYKYHGSVMAIKQDSSKEVTNELRNVK